MNNRDKAIKLAEEYKQIEADIFDMPKVKQKKMVSRIAAIAYQMSELGYPLVKLILKRQKN